MNDTSFSVLRRSSFVAPFKLALIGEPVAHSLSPRMHNAALRALQLGGEYRALEVAPERLEVNLHELVAQGYRGLNVTIPHKQAALPLMDELSDAARAIGAVNTVVIENGRLSGHNTDALGFMRGLTQAGYDVRGKRALVLGAGGAARAVVYALMQAGAHVTVLNRTRERAAQLAREFGVGVVERALPPSRCGAINLIVNTTSVGMSPHADETPLPLLGRGFGAHVVYDLVYKPRDTTLLREARAMGALTIGGIEMLVQQGAEAFRLWTGHAAPVEVMRQALDG